MTSPLVTGDASMPRVENRSGPGGVWRRLFGQRESAEVLAPHPPVRSDGGGPRNDIDRLKASVVDAAPDCVFILDAEGSILQVNRAAEEMIGKPVAEVLGAHLADVISPPGLRDRYTEIFQRAVTDWKSRLLGRRLEVQAMRAGGNIFPAELVVQQLATGMEPALVAFLRDITEDKRLAQNVRHLAYFDQLTGLPNRVQLLERISGAMASGLSFAVVYANLDDFKVVLSSVGRDLADELLIVFAQRIQECLSPGDVLARLHGNEFAVLLEGVSEAGLKEWLDQIDDKIRRPFALGRRKVVVTASIGVARGESRHARPEEVLRDAEIACYQAGATVGTRRVMFDESMRARMVERLRIESDLRRALEGSGELWLAYQPIIDLTSRKPIGFEALVRWDHPERGPIPPAEFVPLAETSGQIMKLGDFVLQEASASLVKWNAERGDRPPLFMSINLSPLQLSNADFADSLRLLLASTEIDPATLKLEITEGIIMSTSGAALSELKGLRKLGVRLSIDDFGTGYSSLSYLCRLPVDTLKIDQTFVRSMTESRENREIVQVIADLANRLKLDVIAEGVESEEDALLLQSLKVRFAQGHHFGRPVQAMQAEQLLDPAWVARG